MTYFHQNNQIVENTTIFDVIFQRFSINTLNSSFKLQELLSRSRDNFKRVDTLNASSIDDAESSIRV